MKTTNRIIKPANVMQPPVTLTEWPKSLAHNQQIDEHSENKSIASTRSRYSDDYNEDMMQHTHDD